MMREKERTRSISIEIEDRKIEKIFQKPEISQEFEELIQNPEVVRCIREEYKDFKDTLIQIRGEIFLQKIKRIMNSDFIDREIQMNLKERIISKAICEFISSGLNPTEINMIDVDEAKKVIRFTFVCLRKAAMNFKFD